jgi:hypothetical protein
VAKNFCCTRLVVPGLAILAGITLLELFSDDPALEGVVMLRLLQSLPRGKLRVTKHHLTAIMHRATLNAAGPMRDG